MRLRGIFRGPDQRNAHTERVREASPPEVMELQRAEGMPLLVVDRRSCPRILRRGRAD